MKKAIGIIAIMLAGSLSAMAQTTHNMIELKYVNRIIIPCLAVKPLPDREQTRR